jgi:hypothetical protein
MTDIAALFAKDPLSLTKDDLFSIIVHYRAARTQFNLGEKQAGAAKKLSPGPKVEKLDLKDLLG